jgi:hypothetical protein
MRSAVFALAALSISLGLSPEARADALDDFNLIGAGYTINFSVPADPVLVPGHAHGVYYGLASSVPATVNGVPGYTASATPQVSLLPELPALYVGVSGLGGLALYGSPFFLNVTEVPVSNPDPFGHPYDLLASPRPGTYTFYAGSAGSLPFVLVGNYFTLTITPEAAPGAATPEPATLTLLLTGIGAAGGLIARRTGRKSALFEPSA